LLFALLFHFDLNLNIRYNPLIFPVLPFFVAVKIGSFVLFKIYKMTSRISRSQPAHLQLQPAGYQPARPGGDQHRGSDRLASHCHFQWARFSAILGIKMIKMKATIPRDGG
jgi:hypothetical protein